MPLSVDENNDWCLPHHVFHDLDEFYESALSLQGSAGTVVTKQTQLQVIYSRLVAQQLCVQAAVHNYTAACRKDCLTCAAVIGRYVLINTLGQGICDTQFLTTAAPRFLIPMLMISSTSEMLSILNGLPWQATLQLLLV